ncbi:unnamed protein product [Durusdinium trenchii]|uniref:Uncharacterized protein n=1 Tax=Durusdinium trenchii TaxID=1381693 RepID=A0ABP0QTN8_9DINO
MQAMPEGPQSLPPRKKKRKTRRGFLEVFLHKMQKPEVVLISVWWFIMLVLVIYMAEMGPILWEVWRPLAFLPPDHVLRDPGLCHALTARSEPRMS